MEAASLVRKSVFVNMLPVVGLKLMRLDPLLRRSEARKAAGPIPLGGPTC
jgi:hypothetical protein